MNVNAADQAYRLDGLRALVTGAGSGIGRAIALELARAGAHVHVADIDLQKARETVSMIESNEGPEAEAMALDVSNPEECAGGARHLLQRHGSLDVLVNNAGIGHVGTCVETSADDLDRMYGVNVRGVFNLCHEFLPGMLERGRGSIVNMASIGGIVGVKDRVAYCATKFAVVGLTLSMALDHARSGVRINCICPGRVETPFVKARLAEYPDPEAAYREMSSTQPMGRMAQPEEIAHAARFLASEASSFMTGHAMHVDGGWGAG